MVRVGSYRRTLVIIKAGLASYAGFTVGKQVARVIGEHMASRATGLEGLAVGLVGETSAYNKWAADNGWFEPACQIATGALAWYVLGKWTPL